MEQPRQPEQLGLVPRTDLSIWQTAVRTTAVSTPEAVLSRLAHGLSKLSDQLGATIRLFLEPNGDACYTGHWVDVEFYLGTISADFTPWPQRFGGAVPEQLDAELELAGWIAVVDGADEEPTEPHGPLRRLVAFVGEDDLWEWAELIAHAVRRIINPPTERWFFHAEVEVLDAGPFHDPPYTPTPLTGRWSIDLRRLLDSAVCETAVWRLGTEGGGTCCALGLHHLHEPACSATSTRRPT